MSEFEKTQEQFEILNKKLDLIMSFIEQKYSVEFVFRCEDNHHRYRDAFAGICPKCNDYDRGSFVDFKT